MSDDGSNTPLPPDIDAALTTNGGQRMPCVLVLDTSGSMNSYERINKLNEGLKAFEHALKGDLTLCQQVVVTVITFGDDVNVIADWTQADEFVAPVLTAGGQTAMGEAMRTAHVTTRRLVNDLKQRGVPCLRPWMFLISDGGPNDDGWEAAAAESKALCNKERGPVLFALGVPPGANGGALKSFVADKMPVYSLGENVDFGAFFEKWLVEQMVKYSHSRPEQKEPVQLTAPSTLLLMP